MLKLFNVVNLLKLRPQQLYNEPLWIKCYKASIILHYSRLLLYFLVCAE